MTVSLEVSAFTVTVSAATRWAVLVTRNIECPVDSRTLLLWGRFVGASVPTLRSRCAAIGVGTKASLDFARLLRAIVRANRAGSDPLLEFDICDVRTIRRLFEIGGLGDPFQRSTMPQVAQFLAGQRLVAHEVAVGSVAVELAKTGVVRP